MRVCSTKVKIWIPFGNSFRSTKTGFDMYSIRVFSKFSLNPYYEPLLWFMINKTMCVNIMGQPSSSQQPNATRIPLFTTWMEAWNIYLSVLLNNNPGRAIDLVGYQRLICSSNKLLPINACLQYDSKFPTIAASNSHFCWNQCHPDLWVEAWATVVTLQQQSSISVPTTLCIRYHFSLRMFSRAYTGTISKPTTTKLALLRLGDNS